MRWRKWLTHQINNFQQQKSIAMKKDKTKVYDVTNRVSSQAMAAIKNCLEYHEKYKRSYFWRPGANATTRRRRESDFRKYNPNFSLVKGNDVITISPSYIESCGHCYYSLSITVNDKAKDVRALKNLI